MDFNVRGALQSWSGGISDRYKAAQDEAAEMRREERMYQTQMNKMKEMERFKRQKEVEYREEDQPYLDKRADADFERERKQQGLLQQDAASFASGQESLAKSKAKDEFIKAGGSEDEWNQRTKDAAMGTTAAQSNMREVNKIIEKYGPNVNAKDVSAADKIKLAVYGVKIPGATETKLSDSVKKDVWKESRSAASEKFSVDNYSEEDAINEAQRITGRKVKSASDARKFLIDYDTQLAYGNGISLLTGQRVTETPQGKPLITAPKEKGPGLMQSHKAPSDVPEVVAEDEPAWAGGMLMAPEEPTWATRGKQSTR